jgi:hypothetical protein
MIWVANALPASPGGPGGGLRPACAGLTLAIPRCAAEPYFWRYPAENDGHETRDRSRNYVSCKMIETPAR